MLTLSHLSKAYAKGNVKAVDDLSLHVQRGEIFGFIGPNGAGKTTTIKMICGIINPDAGSICVHGHDLAKEPLAVKQDIGFVPDAGSVYERLSGLEYLHFLADIYGVDAQTRRRARRGWKNTWTCSNCRTRRTVPSRAIRAACGKS